MRLKYNSQIMSPNICSPIGLIPGSHSPRLKLSAAEETTWTYVRHSTWFHIPVPTPGWLRHPGCLPTSLPSLDGRTEGFYLHRTTAVTGRPCTHPLSTTSSAQVLHAPLCACHFHHDNTALPPGAHCQCPLAFLSRSVLLPSFL